MGQDEISKLEGVQEDLRRLFKLANGEVYAAESAVDRALGNLDTGEVRTALGYVEAAQYALRRLRGQILTCLD